MDFGARFVEVFLGHIWSGKYASNGDPINDKFKAIGFKSFLDHWIEVRNGEVFHKNIMKDFRVKKIILHREDGLAIFVSMKWAKCNGHYMKLGYSKDLKIRVDHAHFQVFVNNYRDAYFWMFKSSMEKRDTFWVLCEQLLDQENFETNILPLLWGFLGVDNTQKLKRLRETVQKSKPKEDISAVIENYEELEFCF